MSHESPNPFAPPKSDNLPFAAAASTDLAARQPGETSPMNHAVISRTVAVLVLAFPIGWSMAEMNRSDLIQYRSLGHRELVAVLEDNASMGLVGCLATAIVTVGIIFLGVFGLSLAIDRALGALTRHARRSST